MSGLDPDQVRDSVDQLLDNPSFTESRVRRALNYYNIYLNVIASFPTPTDLVHRFADNSADIIVASQHTDTPSPAVRSQLLNDPKVGLNAFAEQTTTSVQSELDSLARFYAETGHIDACVASSPGEQQCPSLVCGHSSTEHSAADSYSFKCDMQARCTEPLAALSGRQLCYIPGLDLRRAPGGQDTFSGDLYVSGSVHARTLTAQSDQDNRFACCQGAADKPQELVRDSLNALAQAYHFDTTYRPAPAAPAG